MCISRGALNRLKGCFAMLCLQDRRHLQLVPVGEDPPPSQPFLRIRPGVELDLKHLGCFNVVPKTPRKRILAGMWFLWLALVLRG